MDQQRSGDATRSLFDAVQANDLSAVQASVAAGADLTARDQWGLTPVDLAVDKSYFEVAHFLLSVQNFQRSEGNSRGSAAARQPAAGVSSPAPKVARTATGMTAEKAPPAQPARAQPARQWPADQPNPFDPALPAPGAVLPGDGVGEASRGPGHTAAAERPQVQ